MGDVDENTSLTVNSDEEQVSEVPPDDTQSESNTTPESLDKSDQLDGPILSPDDVTKAEILWSLKVVMSNFPSKYCDGLGTLFKYMFSDSNVAENFTFTKDKLVYLLSYGIAPYFLSILEEDLKISDFYVISLEARLNDINEREEITYYITYWDASANQVETRYLTSAFLEHAKSDALMITFLDSTSFLDKNKILQVSMVGSLVNWSYLKALGKMREENRLSKLINIGTCDVYVVHKAFKAAAETTGWHCKELLNSLFHILHDNPACRCEYIDITGCNTLPLQFNGACWIDNGSVAQRAIDIWRNMDKIMAYWKSQENGKRISSKYFLRIQEYLKDRSVIAKLHFFCFVTCTLKPFIIAYETSKPMVPFLHDDLHNIVRKFMSWFIKRSVLDDASTAKKLCAVDLHRQENYVDAVSLNVGFGAESYLQACLKDNSISIKEIAAFKKGCLVFLIELIERITEQSCLFSSIAENAGSLNPNKMIAEPELSKFRFENLLQKLVELKRLTTTQGDTALREFSEFMFRVVFQSKEKFHSFSPCKDRLDTFFFSEIGLQDYPALANIIKMILCLSHGQPLKKRDLNQGVLDVTNLTETFVQSVRMVQDHMNTNNFIPESFQISDQLVSFVKKSWQHYQVFLDKGRENEIYERNSLKQTLRNSIILEEDEVNLQQVCETYRMDIEKLVAKAEAEFSS